LGFNLSVETKRQKYLVHEKRRLETSVKNTKRGGEKPVRDFEALSKKETINRDRYFNEQDRSLKRIHAISPRMRKETRGG